MSLAEEATKLIREAKRSGGKLLHYNDQVVRNVIDETNALAAEKTEIMDVLRTRKRSEEFSGYEDESLKVAALMHHYSEQRNKRLLMAYHRNRIDKLTKLAWSHVQIPEETKDRLHPAEAEFVESYKALTQWYKGQFLDIGIGTDTALIPPKDVFVQVRVVRDCGTIVTETGASIRLAVNTQHFLRRVDVEPFIVQGFLKHIEH